MKDNLTDQIKTIYENGRKWIRLEIEYARLTVAEKMTVLLATFVFGAVCLLLGMVMLILLSLALADVFKSILTPALAYLCVTGVLILLLIMLFILRRPLIENPISKLISKLILDLKPKDNE